MYVVMEDMPFFLLIALLYLSGYKYSRLVVWYAEGKL